MDNFVFICHSSQDAKQVNQIVNYLESNNIRCWISSKDISAGADWAETIYEAISRASAVVLLFSSNVNKSWQIRNELDIATNLKVPIIPVNLDNSEISGGIKYFSDSHQWLDTTGNRKQMFRNLTAAINGIYSKSNDEEIIHEIQKRHKGRIWSCIIGAALILAALVYILAFSNSTPEEYDDLLNLVVGGSDSWDYATDILAEKDGGFTVAGTWDWGFWSEVWVAHFDSTTTLQWSWSDSLSGECRPYLLPTADGGVITAFGEYADFEHTGFPIRAVRLNSRGEEVWTQRWWIHWTGAVQPILRSMNWDSDSLIILSFTMRHLNTSPCSAVHLISFNSSGEEMLWDTLAHESESYDLLLLEDSTRLHLYKDCVSGASGIELLSSSNEMIQQIIIGDKRAQASCVAILPDGSFLVLLTKDRFGASNGDLSIMKFSDDLALIWEKSYGGDMYDVASDVLILTDGDILISGATKSFGDGTFDGWMLKLDENGGIRWQTVIDMGGNDYLSSISVNETGHIYAAGSTTRYGQPDAWILEMTSDGFFREQSVLGLDVFTEDWERGFIDQNIWLMSYNRNYAPELHTDTINGNISLDANNVALISRRAFHLAPGLSLSAEVSVPDRPGAGGCNWIAIGITMKDVGAFQSDQGRIADSELRWTYTEGINEQLREVCSTWSTDSTMMSICEPESIWLERPEPQLMIIETCTDSVRFWLNDSLFNNIPSPGNTADSIRIYLWGSSSTVPHRIDNVRVFNRRW
ncbi:MAG: toll/interleukin-1 receptor domain-containing protein [Candidatus Aegiribacteria sp.]|nr:toll/interleukin-1 receptor domain-containing protein [Candidatus Aegiribacteria sp.]